MADGPMPAEPTHEELGFSRWPVVIPARCSCGRASPARSLDEWLAPSATGSPERRVEAIRGRLALGCDRVIPHGATPEHLRSMVEAYRPS
jgi:hypothetical protein